MDNISHLKSSRIASLWGGVNPSGQPDRFFTVFFLTASLRYAIFRGRETRHMPSLQLLEDLMLDELKRKYSGGRLLKYRENANEQMAISWYTKQLAGEATAAQTVQPKTGVT